MTFEEWVEGVPAELRGDPLWRMKVYRLAVFAGDLAWHDVSRLIRDQRTVSLSDQLFRAVGSIAANIAEGYSRRSGRDQARFYEYALGSAREARGWYFQGRHVLPEIVSTHRTQLLTEIARLLLTIVPATRGAKPKKDSHATKPTHSTYSTTHLCHSHTQYATRSTLYAIRNTNYTSRREPWLVFYV